MEQVSFFSSDEVEAYSKVCPQLKQVVSDSWLDVDKLKLTENKGYYSISFGPYLVAQLHAGAKPWISIPRAAEAESGGKKIMLADLFNEIDKYTEQLCAALKGLIDAIPTDFSCCSRYEECSNARACVHPDKSVAASCSYRKALSQGRIYYGISRNVD